MPRDAWNALVRRFGVKVAYRWAMHPERPFAGTIIWHQPDDRLSVWADWIAALPEKMPPGEGPAMRIRPFPTHLLAAANGGFGLDPQGIHGHGHWLRVATVGCALAQETGADPAVVHLFGLFHDCRRRNNGHDPDHGQRAADLVLELGVERLRLNARQAGVLAAACAGHTGGTAHPDITVATCWDADRLDLSRQGRQVDPGMLLTEAGRKRAGQDI